MVVDAILAELGTFLGFGSNLGTAIFWGFESKVGHFLSFEGFNYEFGWIFLDFGGELKKHIFGQC